MNLSIRSAQPADAPALAELLRSLGYFDRLAAEPPADTLARVVRHLALDAADDSHTVLVAITPAGELAAYTAVHWLPYLFLSGPEGYVSELFVHPEQRGRGTGARLLEAVQAEARRRGCVRLSLLNRRTRESYRRKFYEKQGWEERDMANFVLPLE